MVGSSDKRAILAASASLKSVRFVGKSGNHAICGVLFVDLDSGLKITGLTGWESGRGERIRTSDSCVPNAVLYQAELRPEADGEISRVLKLYLKN